MTRERAQELIRLQAQWPYWGNFRRFMTPEEIAEIEAEWLAGPGVRSFAGVIYGKAAP